jgi:transcriptional regulator with XRE-family HTH domain
MKENRETIGKKIYDLRKSAGYTQGHLADMSGVSLRTVVGVEKGSFSVRIDILSKLADVFGREIELIKKA